MLAWAVYMPTQGPSQGSLAGAYGGASGDIDVGVGVGANALWGGSARSVGLQPIWLEGSVGLDVTLGVSALSFDDFSGQRKSTHCVTAGGEDKHEILRLGEAGPAWLVP